MRNTFGTKEKSAFGFDAENNQASSPDQLAVVWSGEREVVVASPIPGDAAGSYDLDLARFPAGFNLTAALAMRRAGNANLSQFSEQTNYLTAVSDFSERTRILALSGDVLAYDDDELIEWLVNAERQMFLGTDNHPVFETALEDTACSIRRLPNGQVAMTEVPRQHIQATRERMRSLIGESAPGFTNLTVETPLRCAARYFLTALPEGAVVLRDEKASEATAFLLIGKAGFSYGLWSPAAGLFSEYAFSAPAEINRLSRTTDENSGGFSPEIIAAERRARQPQYESSIAAPTEEVRSPRDERLEKYVRHALDQLFLQLSPEKLEQLELSSYAQVVWGSEPGLSEVIAPIVAEYSANSGLDFFQLPAPSDEAVAGGLLFGSFTFGDATAAGAEIVPPVNLARDILVLADKEEIERRRIEEIHLLKRRNQAVFALLAPIVLVLAALLAITADLIRTQIMTGIREIRADAQTLNLKPALDRRKSYEANLKWYQEFITQVSGLRRQQPVGIGMLYELNSSYPFNIDPSFYVADLKLGNTGGTARSAAPAAAGATNNANCFDCVEIRGLARNKDAVTSFLRSLEFAGGTGSGTRLFSNLAYEVQETAAPTAAPTSTQPALPAMTGSNLTNSNTAPGVIAWSIRGNYMPMAEFAPPDKNKPPTPPGTAATPAAATATPAPTP